MDNRQLLEDLERELLQSFTRKNAARVADLLADNFREFGTSGKAYNKSEIIAHLQSEQTRNLSN